MMHAGCMTASVARWNSWCNIEGCALCNVHCATGAAFKRDGNLGKSCLTESGAPDAFYFLWRKVATASFITESCGSGEWRKVLHRVHWFRLILCFAL